MESNCSEGNPGLHQQLWIASVMDLAVQQANITTQDQNLDFWRGSSAPVLPKSWKAELLPVLFIKQDNFFG